MRRVDPRRARSPAAGGPQNPPSSAGEGGCSPVAPSPRSALHMLAAGLDCFPAVVLSRRRHSNPRTRRDYTMTTPVSILATPDATRMRPGALPHVPKLARSRMLARFVTMAKSRDLRREDATAREDVSAPGRTRTCDPRLRRPSLYPAELRGLAVKVKARSRRLASAPSLMATAASAIIQAASLSPAEAKPPAGLVTPGTFSRRPRRRLTRSGVLTRMVHEPAAAPGFGAALLSA